MQLFFFFFLLSNTSYPLCTLNVNIVHMVWWDLGLTGQPSLESGPSPHLAWREQS